MRRKFPRMMDQRTLIVILIGSVVVVVSIAIVLVVLNPPSETVREIQKVRQQ
jgi:hypothetical protein